MYDDIDIDELREAVKDELGNAAYAGGGPAAFAEMMSVDSMSDDDVIREAQKLGII